MYDLNVPLISLKNSQIEGWSSTEASLVATAAQSNSKKAKASIWHGIEKEQKALIQRLIHTGYSTIAISHTIHGNEKPSPDIDATSVIPDSLLDVVLQEPEIISKKRRRNVTTTATNTNTTTGRTKGTTTILRRLNVIIEQESDLANYSYNIDSKTRNILLSYDLIAFSPRNEAVLSAICKSQNLYFCDIIMLDYTAGRGNVQLPFKLKPSYISAATERGIALELDYASALIDFSKRKGFVQASRQLLNACVGVLKPKPRIILCSGDRVLDGRDYTSMVLRSGMDMNNFCQVILGFKSDLACKVLGEYACLVVERGQFRKFAKVKNQNGVTFEVVSCSKGDEVNGGNDDEEEEEEVDKGQVEKQKEQEAVYRDDDDSDDEGFMKLS